VIDDKSDARLLQEFRRGDTDAFAIFVRRHQDAIYRLAMRNLGDPDSAREATQEVFMRAWQKLGRWRLGRGKPFTWLYRTLKNVCRETQRKAIRQQSLKNRAIDETFSTPPAGPSAEERLAGQELEKLVNGLPERQREVTVLHIYEDLTLQEVANVLGIPVGTVKSSYHKALINLRRGFAAGHRRHYQG
jgi:RNA polymerase sigma-70 factor (ECF subfamily)